MAKEPDDQVELASGFTVRDYREAVERRDIPAIAHAVHRRFLERYIVPISHPGSSRHGFTMMAVACLMIEAIESFRRGWTDTRTKGHSALAFREFFIAHDQFAVFRTYANAFYESVRCGILHQAETTKGWRIRRQGQLLRVENGMRTVNATRFVRELRKALDGYRVTLLAAKWDDECWVFLRKKMERVCENCAPMQQLRSP